MSRLAGTWPWRLTAAAVIAAVVALIHRVEQRTDVHDPWRIPLLGARRTFPLRIQATILVIVLVGVLAAVALMRFAGLMS